MTSSDAIREAVREAHRARIAVVPPKEDGTKAPDGAWKLFQQRRPTVAELRAWYAAGHRTGVGIVTGAVSGDLEAFEFDEEAVFLAYLDAVAWRGLTPLVDRLRASYEEASPGSGIHWVYRCPGIGGNTTLARRPATAQERAADGKPTRTLIQTRSEGGYLVTAPSHGAVHPSGRPYRLLAGGFASIITISLAEREHLFALARQFDRMPQAPAFTRRTPGAPAAAGGRPGDDFDARADWWTEILQPAGWTFVGSDAAGRDYYRRPGKHHGVSADVRDRLLYNFTSSTALRPDHVHSPFQAYTMLFHGGNYAAAAAALARRGYGRPTVTGDRATAPPIAPQRLPGRRHG